MCTLSRSESFRTPPPKHSPPIFQDRVAKRTFGATAMERIRAIGPSWAKLTRKGSQATNCKLYAVWVITPSLRYTATPPHTTIIPTHHCMTFPHHPMTAWHTTATGSRKSLSSSDEMQSQVSGSHAASCNKQVGHRNKTHKLSHDYIICIRRSHDTILQG